MLNIGQLLLWQILIRLMSYNYRVMFLLISLAIIGGPVQAQEGGTLQGLIKNVKTEQIIEGVNVTIYGTNKATATDSHGVFELRSLHAGTYELVISHVSFQTMIISDVEIEPSKLTDLNVLLHPVDETLEEVVISARANRESNLTLLADRQRSSVVIQKVGAQELTRQGLSNVGEGIAKVVGVAMVGEKSLFVRGLGDRYNQATLNGLPIPSPDPDVKLISLGIFPSVIVQHIDVVKSYNAAYYGDFSGGNINIVTKNYPERRFLKVGLSSGFNANSTGKLFYGSKRTDRQMPDLVEKLPVYDSYHQDNIDPHFATPWVPEQFKAPLNVGISVSGGDHVRMANGSSFGYLFSLSNKNEHVFEPGKSAWYNAQQESIYDFATESYQYNTNTSGLLSLNFKPHLRANYALTGLFVNDSKDGVLDNKGINWDLGEIYGRRNTLVQNTLWTGQFSTIQELNDRLTFEGAIGYTRTQGNIPDRTQVMVEARDGGQYQFSANGITDVNRYFSKLNDHDASLHLQLDGKTTGSAWGLVDYSFGFDGRVKSREFNARQMDADARSIRTLFTLEQLDEILSPSRLGIGNQTTWRYKEVPNEQNKYSSAMEIFAPFAQASFLWDDKWSFVAGIRFEQSRQSTDYKLSRDIISAPYRNNTLTGSDMLPSATLKYLLTAKSNLLLAASKTIARPLFTEAAPFRYSESAGTAQRQGNPSLKNGSVYNMDLRYDLFPSPGELFSISIFGKQLYDPIELVRLSGSEPMFSFVNSDRAIVAGVELELNRNLGRLLQSDARFLNQMSIGLNGSYVYSQIEFDESKLQEKGVPFFPTNFKRPLFGASPYLINADLSYKADWAPESFTQFTMTYHVFGKRLFLAGSDGTGDIYEMPVHGLNAVFNTTINRKIGVDLHVNNILDPKHVFNQEFATNNLEYINYRKGVSAGLSLHYTF